eukprot:IDg16978t1
MVEQEGTTTRAILGSAPKRNLTALSSGTSHSVCKRTGSLVAVAEPAGDSLDLEGLFYSHEYSEEERLFAGLDKVICAQQNAELLTVPENTRYSSRRTSRAEFSKHNLSALAEGYVEPESDPSSYDR